MKSVSISPASCPEDIPHVYTDGKVYSNFLSQLQTNFNKHIGKPLFTTDAEGLFEIYLSKFNDEAVRQYHNCNCCRHMIETYGGLVTIVGGKTVPVLWSNYTALEPYQNNAMAMYVEVSKAKVTGVFYNKTPKWGLAKTGTWQHLSVVNPVVFKDLLKTPFQASAEKKEDFKNLNLALQSYKKPLVEQVVTLLKTEVLYRSEKLLGQAEWLLSLYGISANEMWLKIATAPAGFCHPRSSMIGTLLDDLAAGKSYASAAASFADKMHPLKYQRPTAAPAEQAIDRAESIIAKMGIANSLKRRFATLDDIEAIWTPARVPEAMGRGIFASLRADNKEAVVPVSDPMPMTWERFEKNVLHQALAISVRVPNYVKGCQFLTAVDPSAPPILQWDKADKRNPVSWYYHAGSTPASSWNLKAGDVVPVLAVTRQPSQWKGNDSPHQGEGVALMIEGCRDMRPTSSALFPECLKSELHEVRSVVEAFSNKTPPEPVETTNIAAGVMLQANNNSQFPVLYVRLSGNVTMVISIDRYA